MEINKNHLQWVKVISAGVGALILSLMIVLPLYKIWEREQHGRAELAEAEWTKRIAVETAKAKKDSATLEAEAEIERANRDKIFVDSG